MSTVIVRGGLTDISGNNQTKFPDVVPTVLGSHNTAFNYKVYYNNTRTAVSAQPATDLWGVSYSKMSPTSTIYIRAYIKGNGVVNGQVGWYARYGSSAKSWKGNAYAEWWGAANSANANANTYNFGCHTIHTIIGGVTTTGAQNLYIGWQARDGGANAPFAVWNGNNTDEARTNPASGSIMLVWEVEN